MKDQDVPRLGKAVELLRLARLLQGSYCGWGIAEICERFEVGRRTAERMLKAIQQIYPDCVESWDDDGRKRWRIPASHTGNGDPFQAHEVAAIEFAATMMERHGSSDAARALNDTAIKIRAALPGSALRRIEPDHELLALSEMLIQRPGPRPKIADGLVGILRNAILASRMVSFRYDSRIKGDVTQRTVEPYGFIYGVRPYLLAKTADATSPGFRLFSLAEISEVEMERDSFVRDETFSLDAYVSRSFGAYQEPEYDVVWHIRPEAAAEARAWLFHPTQTTEEQPDGSLIVRFRAGGLREMCWHLFTWGGAIEVLAPIELQDEMLRQLRSFRSGSLSP